MELTEKQIQKIRKSRYSARNLQKKFLRKEPSMETLDSMQLVFNKEWLFYRAYLYYESLKKKFGFPW